MPCPQRLRVSRGMVGGGGYSGWGWGWTGTPTYTSALGSLDLKPLPQASNAPTAPSVVSPAVERVQPVMAADIPATPGKTGRWDLRVGTWGEAGRADAIFFSSFQVAPAEPQTVLDALQQRLNKYREAGIQARGSGDERKARMHERIAKVGPQPLLGWCSVCPLA